MTEGIKEATAALKAMKPEFNQKVLGVLPEVEISIGLIGREVGYVIGVPGDNVDNFNNVFRTVGELFPGNKINGYPINVQNAANTITFDV